MWQDKKGKIRPFLMQHRVQQWNYMLWEDMLKILPAS